MRGPRPVHMSARFWKYVNKMGPVHPKLGTRCWLWTGAKTAGGYGRMRVNNTMVMASRVAYLLRVGEVPPGLNVLHHCDNPPCVNPAHLFLGTKGDNIRDMYAKGRQNNPSQRCPPVGELHPQHRLTWNDVDEIRRLRGAGWSQPALVERFGVTQTHISRIVLGKSWRRS